MSDTSESGEAQLLAQSDSAESVQQKAAELLREDAFTGFLPAASRQPEGPSSPGSNGPGSGQRTGELPAASRQTNPEQPDESGARQEGATPEGSRRKGTATPASSEQDNPNTPRASRPANGPDSSPKPTDGPDSTPASRPADKPSGSENSSPENPSPQDSSAQHSQSPDQSQTPEKEKNTRSPATPSESSAPTDAGSLTDLLSRAESRNTSEPDLKAPLPPRPHSGANGNPAPSGEPGTTNGGGQNSPENGPRPSDRHNNRPVESGSGGLLGLLDEVKKELHPSGDPAPGGSLSNPFPRTQRPSAGGEVEPTVQVPAPRAEQSPVPSSQPHVIGGLGNALNPKSEDPKADEVGSVIMGGIRDAFRNGRVPAPEITPSPTQLPHVSDNGTASPANPQPYPTVFQNILNEVRNESRLPREMKQDPVNLEPPISSGELIRNPQPSFEGPKPIPSLQNLLDNRQPESPKILIDNQRIETPVSLMAPPVQDQPRSPETQGKILPVAQVQNDAPRTTSPEPGDNRLPVVSPTVTNKLEMETFADHARSKTDLTVEAKIQSMLSLISELKPARNEISNELASRPVRSLNEGVSRAELPMLQQLVRYADIAINKGNIPEQVNRVFDPSLPTQSLFRQTAGLDALSLKELIALNKGLDASDLRGLKGEPFSLSGLRDPLTGARGPLDLTTMGAVKIDPLTGKLVDGKGDPITGMKVIDGKLDPTFIGLKGLDAIDPKTGAKLLPGDSASEKGLNGTDRKDIADKKEGDSESEKGKDLISMLAASDKNKGKKPEKDGKDEKEENNKKEEQQSRRKYIVREGDTLESIAEKIIGDSRFSILLEMINRGGIRYKWEGSNRKPLLRDGQVLWLPTPNEVKAHRGLFFTRKSKQALQTGRNEDASSVQPAFDDNSDTVQISQTEKYVEMPTVVINNESLQGSLPVKPSAEVAETGTKDPESREQDAIAVDPEHTKASSLSYTPSWSEIQELLSKMKRESEQALQNKPVLEGEQTGTAVLNRAASQQMFKQLDVFNRIVVQDETKIDYFMAKLEREIDGVWTTVAYYESRGGKSVRYLHRANGSRRAFYLNLPQFVIKEMAVKDFSKNWKSYGENFERRDPLRKVPVSHANEEFAAAG